MVNLVTARRPGSATANQAQTDRHPSAAVLHSWYEVFVVICSV